MGVLLVSGYGRMGSYSFRDWRVRSSYELWRLRVCPHYTSVMHPALCVCASLVRIGPDVPRTATHEVTLSLLHTSAVYIRGFIPCKHSVVCMHIPSSCVCCGTLDPLTYAHDGVICD